MDAVSSSTTTTTKRVKRQLDYTGDCKAERVVIEDAILFYCESEEPCDMGIVFIRRSDALFEEDFDALFGAPESKDIYMIKDAEGLSLNALHAIRLLASIEMPSEIGKDVSLWRLPRTERIEAYKELTQETFAPTFWNIPIGHYTKFGHMSQCNLSVIKLDYYDYS